MRHAVWVVLAGGLGCYEPVSVHDAPDSPVKACQEAFLCARKCLDCVGEECTKDSGCAAHCVDKHRADAPCDETRPPSELGADAAWGCEGSQADTFWGPRYVAGLCDEDGIDACACAFEAYACTQEICEEPGAS
jgi:hypothetical protein